MAGRGPDVELTCRFSQRVVLAVGDHCLHIDSRSWTPDLSSCRPERLSYPITALLVVGLFEEAEKAGLAWI